MGSYNVKCRKCGESVVINGKCVCGSVTHVHHDNPEHPIYGENSPQARKVPNEPQGKKVKAEKTPKETQETKGKSENK
ncbi:hypothetical protein N7454_002833 [Penicillium verhagenii]|nr:hypothetical protein N7454_002833 [Penicillium verhagenii]